MYLSWSAFYEGSSDAQYFNVLIPRALEEVIRKHGKRPCEISEFPAVQFGLADRNFERVSDEVCKRKEEFHIIFIHADLGGRALAQGVVERREALVRLAHQKCQFDSNTAVMLSPEKELEAWAICDHDALRAALGVNEIGANLLPHSPRDAERLQDPKRTLEIVLDAASVKKRAQTQILVRIAQEQSFESLRMARSYQAFEESLKNALRHCGFLAAS